MAYATPTQLAAFLGVNISDLPANAASILEQASDVIDWATFGRIDVAESDQAAAAQKATCQQYEYWDSVGAESDITGMNFKSVSIGTFSAQYADQSKQLPTLAPRARRTLFLAGMLYRGVRMI